MAEINADFDDIVNGLIARIGALEKENAILVARLKNAAAQIDAKESPTPIVTPPEVHVVTDLPATP